MKPTLTSPDVLPGKAPKIPLDQVSNLLQSCLL